MNKISFCLMWLSFALVLCAQPNGPGQEIQTDPITWTAKTPLLKKSLSAGSSFLLPVTAHIAPGWHLYSTSQPEGGPIPTRIWIPEGQPFQSDGDPKFALPHKFFDKNFEMEVEYYEGSPVFSLPIKVALKTAAGKHTLTVHARFQACSNQVCLPPKTEKIIVPIQLSGSPAR